MRVFEMRSRALLRMGWCVLVVVCMITGIAGADARVHSSGADGRLAVRQSETLALEPKPRKGRWVDVWTAMPQLTEPANLPPAPFNGSSGVFANATIRQTLRLTLGAEQLRIRISNAFGINELAITAATIAFPSNQTAGISAVKADTIVPLTFSSGELGTVIPNGALAVSDPIAFPVESRDIVTISLYLATGQNGFAITSHPGSRTTTWLAPGNAVSSPAFSSISGVQSTAHWYFLSAIEAWSTPGARALALIGDSITDGRGSETDRNNRWPDLLLNRMQGAKSSEDLASIAILNQAAGGNRVLADGLGPNAQGRVERDVLSHSGLGYALIFEGVNDIGGAAATDAAQDAVYVRLLAAYRQMVSRIHAFGIPVFGATITPFSAPASMSSVQPYSDPRREATRQKVNEFIRSSGVFDAVVDFDAVLRDPAVPSQLKKEFDSGDYLHPNVKGYQALADAFPFENFEKFHDGVSGFV